MVLSTVRQRRFAWREALRVARGETIHSGSLQALATLETFTLFRPVGPAELDLIAASDWREFPPRLPDQPIFYPVLNEGYATQIARDWNVPASGAGFVTRFRVNAEFARRYPSRIVGGREHEELWVPAEELSEFNRNIVGKIEVIAEFRGERS